MTSKRPELSLLRAIPRSFVSIRRVIEVGLDRRRRAPQPIRDLRDRQTLRLATVASKCNSAPTLNDAIDPRPRDVRGHGCDGSAARWCSDLGTPLAPSPPRRHQRTHSGAVTSSKLACRAYRDMVAAPLMLVRTAKARHPRRRLTRSLPHPATSRTARPRVKLRRQFCLFVRLSRGSVPGSV